MPRDHRPCSQCGLKELCLSRGMDAQAEQLLGQSLRQTKSFTHGSALFWQGDAFHALYAVRSGAVKMVSRDASGHERVRGFFLPGDVIGLDALGAGLYPATAETLGESRFCVLPHNAVEQLLATVSSFSRRLLTMASRELAQSLNLAGEFTAEQRIAAFILDMSDRMSLRHGQQDRFRLEMSRSDIANYLRLVPETISRVLGKLSKEAQIRVQRREVAILDRRALTQKAEGLYGNTAEALKYAA